MFHRNESLLRDGTGLAVAGASLTVYVNGSDANGDYTNATKATLYSANSAIPGNLLANPITTDINGDYDYYVADGLYDEVARYGSITEVRSYIQMVDLFETASAISAAAALGMIFISLFTAAPTKSIPIGTDAVQTAGYATSGLGAATYVYDAAVDAAYVAANPRSSFVSANGRGFKLVGDGLLEPRMFGAVHYDPTAPVDAADALNAFYAHAKDPQNARRYVYDARAAWYVAKKVYANFWDGNEPNVARRFLAPDLRVAPIAELPGGVALDCAIEIAGYRIEWLGTTGIHEAALVNEYANTTWATRRYVYGARVRALGPSVVGPFNVDGAKRDSVYFEGRQAGFVSGDGVNFPASNSIGAQVGRVYARYCGAAEHAGANQAPAALAVSAITQGRKTGATTPYVNEVFEAVFSAGDDQRSKLTTVGSTADLAINDMVWRRVELDAATYGTIQAIPDGVDARKGTFVWTAGDPTNLDGAAHGLAVGDIYPIFQGGENVGKLFRITGFSGGSNRTIAVARADPEDIVTVVAAHAATASAVYKQYGEKSGHWVASIIDANNFTVFPYVPLACNSTVHIVMGSALRAEGDDLANVTFDGAEALLCGGSFYLRSNFAPKVKTVLGESCGATLRIGDPSYAGGVGLVIGHGHSEACDFDMAVGTQLGGGVTINMQSLFDISKVVAPGPRATVNEIYSSAARPLGLVGLFHRGSLIDSPAGGVNETTAGFTAISNATRNRQFFAHGDNFTLNVGFDFDEARLFPKRHWAELMWTDTDGSAPDGTLTLNMDVALVGLGWTFAGAGSGTAYSIVAPPNSVRLLLQYLPATKKIAITRHVNMDSAGNVVVAGSVTGGDFKSTTGIFRTSTGAALLLNGGTGGEDTFYFSPVTGAYRFTDVAAFSRFRLVPENTGIVYFQGDVFNIGTLNSGLGAIALLDTTQASFNGKLGYLTGVGGVVAQGTSRTTAVTLNKITGKITLFSTTTTAGQTTTFTWNNSQLGATDGINWTQLSGAGVYFVSAKNNGDGTATVSVYTPAAVGGAEAPPFQFNIIKGVQA